MDEKNKKYQISKWKYKKEDKVYICKYTDEKLDEFELTSKDEPLDELKKALEGLAIHVKEIAELNDDAEIIVTGVTFTHKKDDVGENVLGAVITAQHKLIKSTGVININTPHRINNFYSEHGDEGQLMTMEMEDDLLLLMNYVNKYIQGERQKQMDMFDDGPNEKEGNQEEIFSGYEVEVEASL